MDTAPVSKYAHLSEPNPAWLQVAEQHAKLEELADKLYRLPIEEFRKVPYKPAPLPANTPVPGKDIRIRTSMVAVRDGTDVEIRIYEPLNLGKGHALFFNIHGGGWTVGKPETEEHQNRIIAARNGAVVVSVDYRLAPEYPFPHAVHDSWDVLLWCRDHADELSIDAKKIIIGGGSAGANVAAVLTLMSRDYQISGIIGQVLNIPVTCHPQHFPRSRYEYQSYEQNAKAPIVNAERMEFFWNNYLPCADDTPIASPLLAHSLEKMPPALIQVAGMDPLRDEGLAYAEALQKNGTNVTLKIYPGMPHAFYCYPEIPPSVEYFQTMVDWVDKILSV